MKVKTYRAPTIKQALEEIKKDLGPDAFILGRKEVQPKKLLGVFGKKYFEVAAAVDYSQSQLQAALVPSFEQASANDKVELSILGKGKTSPAKSKSSQPQAKSALVRRASETGNRLLLDEIRCVKSLIQSLPFPIASAGSAASSKTASFSHPIYEEVYSGLVDQGIRPELAYELVDTVRASEKASTPPRKMIVSCQVLSRLSGRIRVAADIIESRPKSCAAVMAFLGPTGVGKTTTLAKLAAQAVLGNRLRVGLITMDTYRIAAVEQLKTYAEIIGVPTKVVENLTEMDAAIKGFDDRDLILIDTAGRSRREIRNQQDIACFMAESTFIQKALVLSATTKRVDLADAIEKYKVFNYNFLILTKLDETQEYGPLIDELVRTSSPVAYLTTGQNVPKDIVRPIPRKMVRLAFEPDPKGWEKFVVQLRTGQARTQGVCSCLN
jgi:flagellar biosynthesis protein FlhF